jgi:NitT/TauT family transport system substrate-binding protein
MGEQRIRSYRLEQQILVMFALGVATVILLLGLSAGNVLGEQVRVGISKDIKCALVYVADRQGFFKKQGLDVSIREYEVGIRAVGDLLEGKVDVATASEFAFVLQSFRNADLRMPASICMARDQGLVVRKDRGIAKPFDLKGKRVAVVRGGQTEFSLHNFIAFNHLPTGSIRIAYHTPSEMVKAMADGTIDAALCWPPYTAEMMKQGDGKVSWWPAQSGLDYYFTLFAREGFLRKESKTVERFLAALSEAELFVSKNPVQTRDFVRQHFGLDAASFLAAWSSCRFQLQLTQDLLVLMEQEAKWAIRNRLVEAKEVPNYLNFFYFNALDKVKPEAVSIVH